MWYGNRNRVLEVHIEGIRTSQESELSQSRNLLCNTREQVNRDEKDILQHQTTSLYIQFALLHRIVPHASIYHSNPSPWSYPPPHNSLSTKRHHIIWCRNTSDHFLIMTNYTATTTPDFRTFPLRLPISLPFHNPWSFCSFEPIPKYHPNLSLVPRAVTRCTLIDSNCMLIICLPTFKSNLVMDSYSLYTALNPNMYAKSAL